jgi:hypothetical protein
VCHRIVSDAPPNSVRCTRVERLQTLHLRVSEAALRYNSPDCPVGHRTVWCASGATAPKRNGRLQRSPTNMNSARTVCAESVQRQKAHRTVNSACPVRHRTVRCAHRQTASPTVELVVGAINTPQPPPLQVSKFFRHFIQYKS